jgi:hypothetical protein
MIAIAARSSAVRPRNVRKLGETERIIPLLVVATVANAMRPRCYSLLAMTSAEAVAAGG